MVNHRAEYRISIEVRSRRVGAGPIVLATACFEKCFPDLLTDATCAVHLRLEPLCESRSGLSTDHTQFGFDGADTVSVRK